MDHNEIEIDFDYKEGAKTYPFKLKAAGYYYLFRKPFTIGPKGQCIRNFYYFAHILKILNLPISVNILEVGCGSGWLCEYLAMVGYNVTGIDISYEMIRIARERMKNLKYTPFKGKKLFLNYEVMDAEEKISLEPKYHAVIFYDALHHFGDGLKVLKNAAKVLVNGGILLIIEGQAPSSGSGSWKNLKKTMKKFSVLELPYQRKKLLDIIKKTGFSDIESFALIDKVEKIDLKQDNVSISHKVDNNVFKARKKGKTIYDSRFPDKLCADIKVKDMPGDIRIGEIIQFGFNIKNTGNTIWLPRSDKGQEAGFVALRLRFYNREGELLDEIVPRFVEIDCEVKVNETISMTLDYEVNLAPGDYIFEFDMVDKYVRSFSIDGTPQIRHIVRII